ncbi:MAG: calcium/proton exchanger [Vicinamibacterales bacterium]
MSAGRLFYGLTLLVPVAGWLEWTGARPVPIFLVSCLAILPLAGLMGEATEHLAHRAGPSLGGLLNATFGNAAELIIGFMALRAGETAIVKASITGSILGNLLMVLGLAMLVGGWRHKELRFNKLAAETSSGTMLLAVVALVLPAIYARVTDHRSPEHIESLSLDISYVLIATYVASLIFQFRTHRGLVAPAAAASEDADAQEGEAAGESGEPPWSMARSLVTLLGAASAVGLVSEFLVGAVDEAGTELGLGKVFMGVIVIAVVGNAAEHSTAILVARKGKMDLALGIAMGSAMQIALFVAPVLVIAGHLIGHPLGLEFTVLEVSAVMLSVMAVSYLVLDGRTHWFEGVQLLAIYTILAMTFYFL